jgi:hypothetical protein
MIMINNNNIIIMTITVIIIIIIIFIIHTHMWSRWRHPRFPAWRSMGKRLLRLKASRWS